MVILALFVLADDVGGVEGQHDAGGDHHSRFLLNIYRRVAWMVGCYRCVLFTTGDILS